MPNNFEDLPTHFVSVTAAMDFFVARLPMYRDYLRFMESRGNHSAALRVKKVIAALENPAELRAKLEAMKNPDGTLVFNADFVRRALGGKGLT